MSRKRGFCFEFHIKKPLMGLSSFSTAIDKDLKLLLYSINNHAIDTTFRQGKLREK